MKRPYLILLFSTFLFCSCIVQAQQTGQFQLSIDFNEADYDFTRNLYYYVPSDYDASKSYKLVVGYRGGPNTNGGQFRDQLTFLSDSIGAIILCPENEAHFNNGEGLTKQLFQYALDTTMAMYSIDTNFIYLTGLSYGGRHAVIVAMDTDNGSIPKLRGVIPFAPGRDAQLEPDYAAIDEFAPACICIGDRDVSVFKTVASTIHGDIINSGGASFLNQIPNVGHTVAFSGFPNEMMECLNFIEQQYVVSNTSEIESALARQLSISPNPVQEVLQIDFQNRSIIQQIKIVDLQGKIEKVLNTNTTTVNVSDLSSGVKILILETEEGRINRKFVVKR